MRRLFLSLFVVIGAAVLALTHEAPQNDHASQLASIQLIDSIVNRFKPKRPNTEIPPSLVLSSLQTEPQALEQSFSPNTRRVVYLPETSDVAAAWTRQGGTSQEASSIAEMVKKKNITPTIRKGTQVTFNLDTDGSLLGFDWRLNEKSFAVVERYLGNSFTVSVVPDVHQSHERVVSGEIITSFVEGAQNAGFPLAMVDDFVDLFSDRIDFRRDLQPGDTFSIILDQRRGKDGKWLSSGNIKAASIMNCGKLRAVIRMQNADGTWQSYNEQGQPLGSYFLRYPVKFTRISSVFTNARFHPVLKTSRPHNGVDFAAPTGTPVRSVADGVVEIAGYYGASGNMVKIAHGKRYSTAYLHLNKISSGLKKGAKVARGELIGTVGSTGLSTGPHLHFAMYENGRYIDPMKAKLPNVLDDKKLASPKLIQAKVERLTAELQRYMVASNMKNQASPQG